MTGFRRSKYKYLTTNLTTKKSTLRLGKKRIRKKNFARILEKNRIRKEKLERIHGTGKSLEELEKMEKIRLSDKKNKIRKEKLEKIYGTGKTLEELESLEKNRIRKELLERKYGPMKTLIELERLNSINIEKEGITLMNKEREQREKMKEMQKYRNDYG